MTKLLLLKLPLTKRLKNKLRMPPKQLNKIVKIRKLKLEQSRKN
jgi:hypothetical protein